MLTASHTRHFWSISNPTHYFFFPHQPSVFARKIINFRVLAPLLKSPLTSFFSYGILALRFFFRGGIYMKHAIAFLLCLIVILSFSSCLNSHTSIDPESETPSSSDEAPIRVETDYGDVIALYRKVIDTLFFST